MYTGRVVRLRSAALVLTLVFVATPLLGVVCEMDCDQPPAASGCHETTVPGGPGVRAAQHACGHDHTIGSPALLAGTSARDSIAACFDVAVPTFAHTSNCDASVAGTSAMHGPPGLSARSTSSRTTILRI